MPERHIEPLTRDEQPGDVTGLAGVGCGSELPSSSADAVVGGLVTNSSHGAVEDGRLLVSRCVVGFRQIRTVRSTASKWDQAQAYRRQLQDPAYT